MRALISVSDKTGIVEFAAALQKEFKCEIISTGGTFEVLQKAGLNVTPVEQVTKSPEMLDGRVKTLHPVIHGGLLAVRNNKDHLKQLADNSIDLIDIVIVNLYPFEATVNRGAPMHEVIENIDIGGPSMLRSAAKNAESVAVIPSIAWYPKILDELRSHAGQLTLVTRQQLAVETFWITGRYDAAIVDYLSSGQKSLVPMEKVQDLRYGENPHQKGTLYRKPFPATESPEPKGPLEPSESTESAASKESKGSPESTGQFGATVANAMLLQGKEMSYLNYLDADAALNMVRAFEGPAASLVKHANPCGLSTNPDLLTAFKQAHDCDPRSAFGVIIALNRPCTKSIAEEIQNRKMFVEVIVAPSFEQEALESLKDKKNIRFLQVGPLRPRDPGEKDIRTISGGFLVQDLDIRRVQPSDLKVVTKNHPSPDRLEDLLFAFKTVRHVKSNAVILAKNGSTVGIGAGQMSRVDSTEIAVRKAGEKAKGSVLASDAFFPFPDSVEEAHQFGIAAIIQPGGSLRDEEVIAKADELGIPMVFTGLRVFKH